MAKKNTINPLAGILSGIKTGIGTSSSEKVSSPTVTSSPTAASSPSALDVAALKTVSASVPNTTPSNPIPTMQATLNSSPTGVISAGNPVQRQSSDPINSYSTFDMNAFLSALQKQNQDFLNAQKQQQEQQQSEIEARINALNQAKQAQAISDLGKARDTQLSNLSGEEAGIKPMYYDKRNATAATNMANRRTLAEELAARGEAKSGVSDQANINANMSLQSETGALSRQEASDIADIARRRTGIQNAYESDVASAKAGLEAATMQNLIDQYNADRQFKLQEANTTGTYNGNQTLEALNAQRNYALNEAGLTGIYNGNQTLDALNAARNYALNKANVTGTYNGSPTLAAQNQTFNQNLATKQYNEDVKQQKLDNLYRQQTFDYQKSRDAVSDSQWQQQMNLNLRQQSFTEAQQKISNALSQSRITQEDAAQALQWARFNAEQDPNSLDNQYKQAQINSLNGKTNTSTTATVDDYANTINSLYIVRPSASNDYKSSIDTEGIQKYLDKLMNAGVDDAIIDSLAARYGM